MSNTKTCKSNQSPFRPIITGETTPREFLDDLRSFDQKSKGCAVFVEQTVEGIAPEIAQAALRCSDAIVFFRAWHDYFMPPHNTQNPQFHLMLALTIERLEPGRLGSAFLCAPGAEYTWFARAMCIGTGAELVLLDGSGPELRTIIHHPGDLASDAPAIWRSYYRQIGPIAGGGREAA